MTSQEVVSSFRDPSGAVFLINGRVFRKVSAEAAPETQTFIESPLADQLVKSGKLVKTQQVPDEEIARHLSEKKRHRLGIFAPGSITLEHERIWFPSYPYEWPAEMLYAAGTVTLDIAEQALADGFGVKDATAYNILFNGPRPIFVDVLSFERRDPCDFIWLAYAQFIRMFLLPLLIRKHLSSEMDEVFMTRAHGLEPEEVYTRFGWRHRLRPPLLTEVSLPTWLKNGKQASKPDLYSKRTTSDPEKAKFILRSQFRRLRRALKSAAPTGARSSHWAEYMDTLSYSDSEFSSKNEFVSRAIQQIRPANVLDIGCNTGHFSAIAAKAGARVVALDIDSVVVAKTWQRACENNLDILPLVINLARPTPSMGWRNAEYPAFLSRAYGKFQMVLMLATLHHLLVTERIPLEEILLLASDLTSEYAIIEFVSKDDSMFKRLLRGRAHLHESFTREAFETICCKYFSIIRADPIKGDHRFLYLLRKGTS